MSLIVLNFHGLGTPHADVPEDERPYWLPFNEFAALLDRIWTKHDPRSFAFTFDDGNASDLEAARMLRARGATGSFFALGGRLGMEHYLSADDLKELAAMGMVVGLHGHDHVDWRRCDDAALDREIGDARETLAAALGAPITEAAIPFGRYDRRVISALRKAGFSRIHTSDGGTAKARARVWNRNTLRADMSDQVLSEILAGRWSLAHNLRRSAKSFVKRNLI